MSVRQTETPAARPAIDFLWPLQTLLAEPSQQQASPALPSTGLSHLPYSEPALGYLEDAVLAAVNSLAHSAKLSLSLSVAPARHLHSTRSSLGCSPLPQTR